MLVWGISSTITPLGRVGGRLDEVRGRTNEVGGRLNEAKGALEGTCAGTSTSVGGRVISRTPTSVEVVSLVEHAQKTQP